MRRLCRGDNRLVGRSLLVRYGGFAWFCAMEDSYRHRGMRRAFVRQLRQKGIADGATLAAIGTVPRHWFLDPAFLEHAYQDKAFPIGQG